MSSITIDELVKAAKAILDEEFKIWGPKSTAKATQPPPCQSCDQISQLLLNAKICKDITQCRQLCNELERKGFLVRYRSGNHMCLRSFPVDYAFKLSDLRKDSNSYYRIGYYETIRCKLPRPDFRAVKQADIANILKKAGLPEWPAFWHESYSEEQREIVQYIVELLNKPKAGLVTIALDTGAGKTEAFLIPSLAYASTKQKGRTKVLIVYPRIALESDQMKRIAELYARLALEGKVKCSVRHDGLLDCIGSLPAVVVRDGASPHWSDVQKGTKKPRLQAIELKKVTIQGSTWKCKSSSIDYDQTTRFYRVELTCEHSTQQALLKLLLPITDVREAVECSKHSQCAADIVVTNYDMVNRMLAGASTPLLHDLLSDTDKVIMIFDEAHLYHGPSLVALLALLARLAKQFGERLLVVISSATLPNLNEYVDIIKGVLGAAAGGVDVRGPIQVKRDKLTRDILVSIVQAEPKTAASWLYQLATLQTITQLIALKFKAGEPRKALGFFDSVGFLLSTIRNTKQTLYNSDELPGILKDHYKADPKDAMDWSPYIDAMQSILPAQIQLQQTIDWGLLASSLLRYYPLEEIVAAHFAGLNETERARIETAFKEEDKPLLVLATSTLEVGIDVPDVTAVGLYRLPPTPQSLMQRIGRAGRSAKTAYIANAFIILSNYPRDTVFIYDEKRKEAYLYRCYPSATPPPLHLPVNLTFIKQHYLLSLFDELVKDRTDRLTVEAIVKPRPVSEIVKKLTDNLEMLKKIIRGSRKQLEDSLKVVGSALYEAYRTVWGSRNISEERYRDLVRLLNNPGEFIDEVLKEIDNVIKQFEGEVRLIDELKIKIETNISKLIKITANIIEAITSISSALVIKTSGNREGVESFRHILSRMRQEAASVQREFANIEDKLVHVSNIGDLKAALEEASYIVDDAIERMSTIESYAEELADNLKQLKADMSYPLGELDRLKSLSKDAADKLEELREDIDHVLNLLGYVSENIYQSLSQKNKVTILELLARIFNITWASIWLDRGSRSVTYRVGERERDIDSLTALIRLTPLTIREG